MFKAILALALTICLLLPLTAPGQEPGPTADAPSTPVPDVPSSQPADPDSAEQRIRDQHAAAELRYRNLAAQREKLEADFKAALDELLKQQADSVTRQDAVTPPAAPLTSATETASKPVTPLVAPAGDDAKKKPAVSPQSSSLPGRPSSPAAGQSSASAGQPRASVGSSAAAAADERLEALEKRVEVLEKLFLQLQSLRGPLK
jgi:hypothetical protein